MSEPRKCARCDHGQSTHDCGAGACMSADIDGIEFAPCGCTRFVPAERRQGEDRRRRDRGFANRHGYMHAGTIRRSGSDRRASAESPRTAVLDSAVGGEGARAACVEAVDYALGQGWRPKDIVGLLRGAQRYANGFVVAVCSRCRRPEYEDGLILTEVIDAGDDLNYSIVGGGVCPQCKMKEAR